MKIKAITRIATKNVLTKTASRAATRLVTTIAQILVSKFINRWEKMTMVQRTIAMIKIRR